MTNYRRNGSNGPTCTANTNKSHPTVNNTPASQTVPCAVISRTLKGADLKTQLLSRTKYIKLSNRPLLYELGTVWNMDMLYLLPTLY